MNDSVALSVSQSRRTDGEDLFLVGQSIGVVVAVMRVETQLFPLPTPRRDMGGH